MRLDDKRTLLLALVGVTLALAPSLVEVALVPPGTLPYHPSGAISDVAIAHWPNAYYLRTSVWEHGQWPLWQHTRMLGMPFAANPLSKVWYPPQWLVLLLPPTLHLNLLLAAHLAWLSFGMLAWARSERLNPLAGVFASLAFGLNPKMLGHLGAGHLDIVYALAWTPWLLWAAKRLSDHPDLWRGAVLSVIAAMLALADLRVAFYMLPVSIVYWLALTRINWRTVGAGLVAVGVFSLLMAVQIVPLIALAPYLTRVNLSPTEASVYSLPPGYLWGVLLADRGGFHEWMTYLGVPALGLAVMAVNAPNRAKVWAWSLVAIFAALWAMGNDGPLYGPVLRIFPWLAWQRVPSRAWLVVDLSVSVLGAWGLDALLTRPPGRWARLGAMAIASMGATMMLAVFLLPTPGNVLGAGAALLGTGVGIWSLAGGLSPDNVVGQRFHLTIIGTLVLLVTLVASLLSMATSLVRGRPIQDVLAEETDLLAALESSLDTRVYSPSFYLIGPATAQSGIPTLHAVDPFQLTTAAEAIRLATGAQDVGYSVTAPPLPLDLEDVRLALVDASLDPESLAALGVGWIVADFEIEGLDVVVRVGPTRVYRLTGTLARVVGEQGRIKRIEVTPNGLTVVAEGCYGCELVIAQTCLPGWFAEIDGESTPLRADGPLTQLDLPPGDHRVALTYRPVADIIGAVVSGATVIALAVWGLCRWRAGAKARAR